MRVAALISFSLLLLSARVEAQEEVREGLDWVSIPLLKFNDDAGFVYGAKLELVDFDPDVEPFAWNLELKLLHSTKNRHEHRALVDVPRIGGSAWRLTSRAEVLHIDDANFFGLGNDSTNTEDAALHLFQLTEARARVVMRRPISGALFVAAGLTANLTLVDVEETSLLALDPPEGAEGGTGLGVVLSLGHDSRDDELVPRRGAFLELYTKGAALPSQGSFFFGAGAVAQLYVSPASWLVLAQRLMVETLFGDVPFYEAARMGGSVDFLALGGVYSQRGFVEGRFAGRDKILSNSEARVLFPPLWERLLLGVGLFADLSRVLDSPDFFAGLHPSAGAALYINWDNAFVFRVEEALSEEGALFYIEGRYLF